MHSEADTCRTLVLPKLYAAGWNDDQIAEQRTFTAGRIVVHGQQAFRRPAKRADYLLRFTRDLVLAVIEAKPRSHRAADGLQQAKEYAQILNLKFAYATNGTEIIEFDFITGTETQIAAFPSPSDLWNRRRRAENLTDDTAAERVLTPVNLTTGKDPYYYQHIAINSVVQAILQNKKRVLLTMATGTGKTVVAFQICWKLWSSKWNAKGDPTRKPRILYLADRTFLVDDPKDKIFAPFGDARIKIEGGKVTYGRQLYFSTYQSIAQDENRPGLYKEFAPDFFDLIIVDECHRGSAKDSSSWREILEYFQPAFQLGMTATPLREENRDSYLYFGNPVYTYSLRQGIEDGYLAPYRVHRIVTQWDAAGWRPSKNDLDRFGRAIPDEEYQTRDFERLVALRARTNAIAKHLTDFLKKTDRFAKSIVFCVDQEHASEMRTALNNLNADLVSLYPNYVCRVTSDEGDIGKGHMQRFQDPETNQYSPTILTTSQLLTTGLDAPTCRNVVLVRLVNSMVEFKQIIGRGTRVREDYGKLFFNIIDYTGAATRNFADPAFDGDPAFASEEEIDENGKIKNTEIITPETPEEDGGPIIVDVGPFPPISGDVPPPGPRKYYFDGGQVEVAAHLVYELDPDGKQLRVLSLTDYTAEKVRTLFASPSQLRASWASPSGREEIIAKLHDRGISFDELALRTGHPEADPFDLLCHVAFHTPLKSRRARADKLTRDHAEFFRKYGLSAQKVLSELLEKYAEHGATEFTLPDVLRILPSTRDQPVAEVVSLFGGPENLRRAVTELQILLYAA